MLKKGQINPLVIAERHPTMRKHMVYRLYLNNFGNTPFNYCSLYYYFYSSFSFLTSTFFSTFISSFYSSFSSSSSNSFVSADICDFTNSKYAPFNSVSSEWVPYSTTWPFLSTKILSAFWIVDNRCATTTVVIFPDDRLLNVFWIPFSFFLSKADVASSRISKLGFFAMALAIAILCFCPPENWAPPAPTYVSSPFSEFYTNYNPFAWRKISFI